MLTVTSPTSIFVLILAVLYKQYGPLSYTSSTFPIDVANRRRVSVSSAANIPHEVIGVTSRDVVYEESEISMILQPVKFGFAAPVKISNQTFQLLVDTASSDTWVVDSFFTCLNDLFGHVAQAYNQTKCIFGPTYDRGLDDSFRYISGYSFKVSLESGDGAGGPLGYAAVELAKDLEVPAQQIGLASAAVWGDGDGIVSGILGLGFPGLTHRFRSTNLWEDIPCWPGFVYPCNQDYYQSVTWSLFKNFTTADNIKNEALLPEQTFSLALARNSSVSSGLLTFGGVPNLTMPTVNVTTAFIRVPLEIKKYDNDYRHYVVSTISFTYGAANNLSKASTDNLQFVVDAGSIWNLLPANVSKVINLSFSPPAFRYTGNSSVNLLGLWAIDCTDYVAPEVGIELGGMTFWHNKEDLVRRFRVTEYTDDEGSGSEKEVCISTIQDGVDGATGKPNSNYNLGQPLLNNVLAVFDIGRLEMGFAKRIEYA